MATPMERKALGLRLRELREAAGVSQKALADKLKEDQTNVSRWERGKMEIPAQHIPEICAIIGCEYSDLFREPEHKLKPRGRGRPPKPKAND
jgi:transcriptional regulator with XRE-family HTH domain